jgi:hypothetical protein
VSMDVERAETRLSRRKFVMATAGAVAGAGLAKSFVVPEVAGASGFGALPPPEPIPGGPDLPPVIHIFLPGDPSVTLPFSGLPLEGLDVEPATVTNFDGATAAAFIIGTATGSDGVTYGLEVDLRVSEGEYVAADGSVNHGAFALI